MHIVVQQWRFVQSQFYIVISKKKKKLFVEMETDLGLE